MSDKLLFPSQRSPGVPLLQILRSWLIASARQRLDSFVRVSGFVWLDVFVRVLAVVHPVGWVLNSRG